MKKMRALVPTALAALAVGGITYVHGARMAAIRGALALVAEAQDLCSGSDGSPLPGRDTPASMARLAAGAEALTIVAEISDGIRDRRLRGTILEVSASLGGACRPGDSQEAAAGADVDDRGRASRAELIAPFIARMSEAVTEVLEAHNEPVPSGVETEDVEARDAIADTPTPAPPTDPAQEAVDGPGTSKHFPAAIPTADTATPQTLELEVGASGAYRRRVAAWTPVFRRESEALMAARRVLQAEIDAYSVAQARGACRAFGRSLERLDPEFAGAAPYRELMVRVGRMLARYRQGVTECVKGRPAGAFSYLSEGDREWSALARAAAGVVNPRPAWSASGKKEARPETARSKPRRGG